MAFTGLKFPLQVNKNGGAKIVSGSEQLRKLLLLALSEGDDDNPFQDLGIDMGIIYSMQSTTTNAEIIETIKDVVRTFGNRIKLLSENPITTSRTNQGELEVTVRWIDTNLNKEDEFKKTFQR